jgi:Ni,Fe-hydrogenase III large subunit
MSGAPAEAPHLLARIGGSVRVLDHHPWPRLVVEPGIWRDLGVALAAGRLDLMGLFADGPAIHAVLLEPATSALAVVSLPCHQGRYPSLGQLHPPALRPERAIHDLHGLTAEDAPDDRPWLDHGRWSASREEAKAPYPFLPVEGEGLHQIPVGPVHAGIIEPGHFRFTCNGETVVRLEERLGYVHKGIEALLVGADLERAARIISHVSGDSTVAYQIAFARAVEAATGGEPPRRAVWLRALMAELERIANHVNDVGFIANDAAFALLHAHCGILREQVLQACDAVFGHRLMMDRIVPGGVAVDLTPDGAGRLRHLAAELRGRFVGIVSAYDGSPSLKERTVGTGIVSGQLARRFAAGGHVGRASGRSFDCRRDLAYPPYDRLRFEVPVLEGGDVDARVWVRIREVEQSLGLVEQILEGLPEGPVLTPVRPRASEGLAFAEAFRGDVLVWVRLDAEGRIGRCHPRDPSWFQWPLLEAAVEGNIVADFPLCNKSFNCSYSGHDL